MPVRLTILLFLLCFQAGAANKYLRAGASGAANGNNWTDAYTTAAALETALARGDTGYVASGDYGGPDVTFNTVVSGTTLITIKKATVADHGTDTGWDNSYATGQAVFGRLVFSTGYWWFDGIARTAWNAGHGFKAAELGQADCIRMFGPNVTLRYVEVVGNGGDESGGTPNNDGIAWRDSGAGDNATISYCYFRDLGRCVFFCNQSVSGVVIEHCYTDLFESWSNEPAEHAEVASIWGGANNWTFRYNLIGYVEGTGGLILEGDGFLIYGNIFYRRTADTWENGNGVIGTWTVSTATGVKAHYNTFININSGQVFGTTFTAPTTGNEAKNNLFYNVSGGISYSLIPTHDYNHYVDSGSTRSEANGTSGTGNPFVSVDALNFRLTADTAAGVALGAPYDGAGVLDLYGNERIAPLTRGAAKFMAEEAPAAAGGGTRTLQDLHTVNLILGLPQ